MALRPRGDLLAAQEKPQTPDQDANTQDQIELRRGIEGRAYSDRRGGRLARRRRKTPLVPPQSHPTARMVKRE